MKCLKKKTTPKQKVAGFTTALGLITVGFFVGNTPEEIEINTLAIQQVETIFNSQKFFKCIFESKLDLSQANGMSHAQLVQDLRSNKVEIDLEAYRKDNNTIGYTYASSHKIWFNRKFHDKFTQCEKVKNYAHEITHKMGYKHDVSATKSRPFSVPYIVGSCSLEVCKSLGMDK